MKRFFLKVLVLLLLSGIGVVVWTAAGRPPVRMVWQYGFSYHPEPTGKVVPYEDVEFVEIGPGCFLMGSNQGAEGGDFLGRWCARLGLPWGDQPKASDEMPVHWVEFQRGFFIARTEVTNEQFEAFAPGHERHMYTPGDRDPVVNVSWVEAREYCAWLSKKSGLPIRLPSEAEWECACRAGSNREFCFGDEEHWLELYAWFGQNSDLHAHEVGSKRANAFGLHDLHGNALEWCEDTYHPSYIGAPAIGTPWTDGGTRHYSDSPDRIYRGGSFYIPASFSRAAHRTRSEPEFRLFSLGFRLAFSHAEK